MHLKRSKPKGVAIDGIPIRRSSELIGLVNIVFFSPEDLGIIKHGPSGRRRFLDMELCQLDRVYYHDLAKYNKVMEQRNNLLKQITYDQSLLPTLDIWDEQLVEYGCRIIRRREKHMEQLNEVIASIHHKLSGGKEKLVLGCEFSTSVSSFRTMLEKNREKDLYQKVTSVGPHRDDIVFYINNLEATKFASQGQQRTIVLSLKLSELDIITDKTGDDPKLLLDDVLAELDDIRQNYLLKSINPSTQTIITSVDTLLFEEDFLKDVQIYKIEKGSIIN